ncbi:MAG: BNR-4 repeat-containing protein, partial [Bacteroidota bacterium]
TIGDSHNTIAVEANPVDGSIHMLYDMHAYSQASYPDDFFNYSVSKNGVAQITDGEFDLSLFFPKRNYLKRGEDYDRATYPEIQAAPNGQMIVRYRLGGAGNGDIIFSSYEAGAWGAPYRFSDGTIPLPDRYSLYGSERFIRGRLHAGFSVRYAQNPAYALNSGLHYAYADAPYGPDNWRDIDGNPVSIPFGAPDALRVGTPEDDHGTADAPRTAQGPHFTVTAAGDIHFVTRVDNRNVHYWRAAGQQAFQSAVGGEILRPDGYLFDYGEYVVATGLINDRVVIRAARGGTNDWETLYQQQGGAEYDHFNGIVSDDQLLLYAMREASSDARPLHLLQFQLSGGTTSVNAPTREAPRVFPNPTTGRLSIDVGGTDAPYQLYDLGGRLLKSGNVDGRLLQLDGYAAGVYLLRVRTSSGWAARRIVLH